MSKNLLRLCLFVNMPSYLLYLLLILLLWFGAALSRPKMQRITINHHVWEVPNEPGWDEVVKDVELVQQSLSHHPVSRKYLETHSNSAKNILASIFKWG
ncbi:unnamed protein product [Adineta ricciae]|uniref:Uncharacterized protein n=1 Tax=Adineta ricciae TaxID=249248 RepID=A0A815BAZ1_ADIRI|nr:unnamed protein product [Adineta ricciae]